MPEGSNLPIDTAPSRGSSRNLGQVRYGLLSRPSWKKILIIADYFSKFPYIFPVTSTHHFKDHQPSLWTLHSWRHTCHCDVWQWPSIQWRRIQKVCSRVLTSCTPHHHLISCTPHHHLISTSPMVSSRPWWRKSRTPTRKPMYIQMLKQEHYFSYKATPILDRSSFSYWNSSWMTCTRSSHFKTLKADQQTSDSAETHWNTEHTEGTVQQSTQSKGSMSAQNEWTSAVLSEQTRDRSPDMVYGNCNWNLGLWSLIHDPRPQLQSLRRNRAHLKAICYGGMSFQDHAVKKEEKKPEINSFQDPKPTKVKNCVLPDGHQLHQWQIHFLLWNQHTSDIPFITITSAAILTQVTIIFTSCI